MLGGIRNRKKNIVLIGMPTSGKSSVGVALAKDLNYSFVDSDLLIQEQEGRLLREIIAQEGIDAFQEIENRVNAQLDVERAVIAPGGSVIYGKEAMEHFRETSLIVYLKISFEEMKQRLGDAIFRGVTLREGMSLRDLYEERVPLYEKYADAIIDEQGKTLGQVVSQVYQFCLNTQTEREQE
ncbi:MAG: shikimate kinase [Lachnospiraceae bacterium]